MMALMAAITRRAMMTTTTAIATLTAVDVDAKVTHKCTHMNNIKIPESPHKRSK